MKVLIEGLKEDNLEELVAKLSELGISPAPIYNSLQKGLDKAIIDCRNKDFAFLSSSIGHLCRLRPLEEKAFAPPSLLLVAMFLDTILLFYILKLSLWSEDFNRLLNILFNSSVGVFWSKAILSLFFIGIYQHAFFSLKGAPPISSFLGMSYTKDKYWTMFAYAIPLISLYLISIGSNLFKLIGLVLLSISVALVLYSEREIYVKPIDKFGRME